MDTLGSLVCSEVTDFSAATENYTNTIFLPSLPSDGKVMLTGSGELSIGHQLNAFSLPAFLGADPDMVSSVVASISELPTSVPQTGLGHGRNIDDVHVGFCPPPGHLFVNTTPNLPDTDFVTHTESCGPDNVALSNLESRETNLISPILGNGSQSSASVRLPGITNLMTSLSPSLKGNLGSALPATLQGTHMASGSLGVSISSSIKEESLRTSDIASCSALETPKARRSSNQNNNPSHSTQNGQATYLSPGFDVTEDTITSATTQASWKNSLTPSAVVNQTDMHLQISQGSDTQVNQPKSSSTNIHLSLSNDQLAISSAELTSLTPVIPSSSMSNNSVASLPCVQTTDSKTIPEVQTLTLACPTDKISLPKYIESPTRQSPNISPQPQGNVQSMMIYHDKVTSKKFLIPIGPEKSIYLVKDLLTVDDKQTSSGKCTSAAPKAFLVRTIPRHSKVNDTNSKHNGNIKVGQEITKTDAITNIVTAETHGKINLPTKQTSPTIPDKVIQSGEVKHKTTLSYSNETGGQNEKKQIHTQDNVPTITHMPRIKNYQTRQGRVASIGGVEPEEIEINVHIEDSQQMVVDGQKRWCCLECPKNYGSKHNLTTHILGHNGLKPFLCIICTKRFRQQSHLQTHMLTHSIIKPYSCPTCGRGFTQISHLKRHLTLHMERRPCTCNICDKGFAFPSELKLHIERHRNGQPNICDECQETFNTPRKLKQHKRTVHRHNAVDLTCKDCGRIFTYRSQLRDHVMSIHEEHRPFSCPECGMNFTKEYHLRSHQFLHTGLTPYSCEICHRSFNQKANMQRHMLVHQRERQHKCDVCERSFTQLQVLKSHMVTHSKVKPHQCNLCGKYFSRVHNLNAHMHIHKGSKPHICFCGSSFTLRGNLTRHKKGKHGIADTDEYTDEEAAKILNAMSAKHQSGNLSDYDHVQEDSLDEEEEDMTIPRKRRKSMPRKSSREEGYEDPEAVELWRGGDEDEESEEESEEESICSTELSSSKSSHEESDHDSYISDSNVCDNSQNNMVEGTYVLDKAKTS